MFSGGPGGGCGSDDRRYFNPSNYRIIIFDQRGSGKSLPAAELNENDTFSLVDDIEKIRSHLEIEKWVVFGGSWGSTLALTYAIKHPERVKALILRGIFTLRKRFFFSFCFWICSTKLQSISEIDWFYQSGASHIFPDAWDIYIAPIPVEERHDMIKAYYKRLTGSDEMVRKQCAKAWSTWEMMTSKLYTDPKLLQRAENDTWADQFARIECHYFVNGGFFEYDGWVLDNVNVIRDNGIPGVIVQGRYDVVCPAMTAWELHKKWPEAEFHMLSDSGHSAKEKSISKKLVEAAQRFETL